MDPILIPIPESLSTQRLDLRLPHVGEGAIVAAAVIASRVELQPFMPWATDTYRLDDGETWCRRVLGRYYLREQVSYAIFERATGEFIGGLGPHRIDWKIRLCEIGYWLRSDRTGHGFMTEALGSVVEMLGTTGLRRIEVRCDVRNARSAAVARRCGFEHEGTLRADALDSDEGPRTTMIFSRIMPPASHAEASPVKSA